jgi:periplasmic divalent cation tolerance protein
MDGSGSGVRLPNRTRMMERAVFVYTTWPTTVEAEQAGRTLIERRLAACVNILPGMISQYRWEGRVERGEEAVMIVKTRASLADAVSAAVKELHSYTVPAILVIPLESVENNYLRWLMDETREPSEMKKSER